MAGAYLLVQAQPGVSAISEAQSEVFNSGVYYFDVNGTPSTSCVPGGGGVSASSDKSNSGSWNSGVQPPYYLEIFAIEVLKDLAAKTGVPESSTVTQEHVIALVGWMWIEGGGLTNTDYFNPLNTNRKMPGSVTQSTGEEAYPNFDTGVEATTRALTDPFQTRVAQVLSDPGSSAEQFVQALTYFQNYPGNLAWATADDPNTPGAQQQYYNTVLSSVEQARNNYASEAATIMGSSENQTAKVPASKLQFSGGGGAKTGPTGGGPTGTALLEACGCTGPGSCPTGIFSGSIVQTAIGLAWPSGDHGPSKSDATSAYQVAMPKYDGATTDFSDCGAFVATVMIASGADTNYYKLGTANQAEYVKGTANGGKPGKYTIIPLTSINDSSQLHAGDILIYDNGPGDGHTFIYVGNGNKTADGTTFQGDSAGASQGGHVPQAGTAAGAFSYAGRINSGKYFIARLNQ